MSNIEKIKEIAINNQLLCLINFNQNRKKGYFLRMDKE